MAGIYLHIPFCKQACHYCDFHFTTSLRGRDDLLQAMLTELKRRSPEAAEQTIDTIYFGGGTPSLLSYGELMKFFDVLYTQYKINPLAEITLEANPDDLSKAFLKSVKSTPVNRLSIGIQSFHSEDLLRMNRAHDAAMAKACVPDAAEAGFENISVDLIYGLPFLDMQRWQENVRLALMLPITHLSCYGLTIEPKTALSWQITKGQVPAPDDDVAASQYEWLLDEAEAKGFPWYEISNLSKPGMESKHNTSYWNGIPYIGIGPSAHSFNGQQRRWNVKSNALYLKEINEGKQAAETEVLSHADKFHELILTSLRVRKGLAVAEVRKEYGVSIAGQLIEAAGQFVEKAWLEPIDTHLRLTRQGLLFADKITAELFII